MGRTTQAVKFGPVDISKGRTTAAAPSAAETRNSINANSIRNGLARQGRHQLISGRH